MEIKDGELLDPTTSSMPKGYSSVRLLVILVLLTANHTILVLVAIVGFLMQLLCLIFDFSSRSDLDLGYLSDDGHAHDPGK